ARYHGALAGDRHALGVVEPAGCRELVRPGDLEQRRSRWAEDLGPERGHIADPEVAVAVDGGLTASVLELAEGGRTARGDPDASTGPAESDQRVPAQVVLVDVVGVAVDGVDPAVLAIDRQPADVAPGELPDTRSVPAEREEVLAGGREHRDPEVERIHHVQTTAPVEDHAAWLLQLSGVAALRADRELEVQVVVVDVDDARGHVGDVDPAVIPHG